MRELELRAGFRIIAAATAVTLGALTMPAATHAQQVDEPRPAQGMDMDRDVDAGDEEQNWGWVGLLGLAGLLGLRRRDRDDVRSVDPNTRRTL